MLKKMINQVLDNSDDENKIKIKSVLADGAHDTNRNFQYLEDKRIIPGIKVRKNSIVSSRNNKLRNKEAISQSEDLLKWKKKRKYGYRWIAETTFTQKNVWRTCKCYQVSKHGKRNANQGIIV